MKRLAFFVSLVAIASVEIACSGSGTTITPPPPTGGFTNASLKGNYAFSMIGTDPSTGGLISRVGSFVADGSGNITNALEDVDVAGTIATVSFSSSGSNYTIQANGKGTMTLMSLNGPLQFSIALSAAAPAGQGLMIQSQLSASTPITATASGTFSQQNIGSFSQPFAAATYVFDVSGVENTIGAPISLVGEIAVNSGGTLGAGTADVNNGADPSGPSGPTGISSGGTYAIDATNAATFGRGTITFGGLSFVYYSVDQTHARMLEVDAGNQTSGDFFEQTGTIPTQNSAFTSSFVYLIGGTSSSTTTVAPIVRAARFTADGNGNMTAIRFDQNNGGTFLCVDTTGCSAPSATGTYVVGSGTNFAVGRGTVAMSIQGQNAPVMDVFYMISPTSMVIQDNDLSVVGDGTMAAQTGTFSTSALAGNYAFNLSGQVLPSGGNVGFEEDFVGQYVLSSSTSSNVTGISDIVELGSTTNQVPVFLNVPITGTLNVNGDGTGRNGFQLVLHNVSPAPTVNFTAYFASPQQMFLVSTGNNRVTAGAVLSQVTP